MLIIIINFFNRVKLILIFLLLLTLFSSGSIIAQQNFRFEHLGYESGIPENSTFVDIIQDSIGFLWIASSNALFKYDGYEVKVYKHNKNDSSSIIQGTIRKLLLDKDNYLWMITENGLSMYLREKDKFINYYVFSELKLQPVNSSFVEDKNGIFWLSTQSHGLISFNKLTKGVEHIKHDDNDTNSIISDYLSYIVCDNSNNLWISAYGKGLEKFDISNKLFTHYPHSGNNINTVGSDFTNRLYIDNSGIIWIELDSSRFDELDPVNLKFDHHKLNIAANIASFHKDRSGLLWIATGSDPGGLILFNKEKGSYTYIENDPSKDFSPKRYNTAIYEDKSGIIWLGTINLGFSKFNRRNQVFRHYENYLNLSPVRSITGDNSHTLWCGTYKGLDRLNLLTGKYTHYGNEKDNPNSLINDVVIALLIEKDSTLWIGTKSGLCKLDILRNKFTRYTSDPLDTNSIRGEYINKIYKDSFGEIWITTIAGLNKYNSNSGTFTHYKNIPGDSTSFPSGYARAVFEDNNKTLWIGASMLSRYNRDNNTFRNFDIDNIISSICSDNKNNIWLTTYTTGLNLFDINTGKAISYKNPVMLDDYTCDILADNSGKLWIISHQGLSCFDPEKQTYTNFGKAEKLGVSDFYVNSAYKDSKGILYFGGDGGIICFNPDSVIANIYIPNIVLTDFKIFNNSVQPSENSPLKKQINEAEEINLSYKDNSFSFEFAALDYNNPGRNQFAYKMEGFDKDWIISGNIRTATYTNLDPGEYFFHVKGSNNDGVWNEKGTSVKIIIIPPWWQTWWFRGFGIILIIGFLGYSRYRKLSKIRNEIHQKEEFTKQLINTQEAERKRIAGELHDSLGQNLLVIKNKLLLEMQAENKNNLEDISNLTSKAIDEVRIISHNLSPYEIDRLGLTEAIESIMDNVKNSTNIHIDSEIDKIDNMLSKENEINFYRIIQECMTNIIKHSKAEKADIRIKKTGEIIEVNIKDDGTGFDPEKMKSRSAGMGLAGLQERVNILNGQLIINSISGKGTEIKIIITTQTIK